MDSRNWIVCGNALRLDWLSICPPTGTGVKHLWKILFHTPLDQTEIEFENEGGETFICGNPPYLGSKKKNADQVSDMEAVGQEKLNYWITSCVPSQSANFIEQSKGAAALVVTSSLCQGEQVGLIWPQILKDFELFLLTDLFAGPT